MATSSIRVLLVLCITSMEIRLFSAQNLKSENATIELGLYFSKQPEDTIAVRGKTVILHCSAYTTFPNGVLSYEWTRNDVNVNDIPYRNYTNIMRSNSSLLSFKKINWKKKKSDGQYRCVVTVEYESMKLALISRPAVVQIANLSTKNSIERTINITSTVGRTVRLKCEIYSVPAANITWTFRDEPLQPNNEKYDTIVPGVLYIVDLRSSDSGEYKCHATNNLLNLTLSIVFYLRATTNATHFLAENTNDRVSAVPTTVEKLLIRLKDEQMLDCFSENQPPDTDVVWTYRRRPEDRITTVNVSKRGYSVLRLKTEDISDSGTYVCQHAFGSQLLDPIRKVTVDISTPPVIIEPPESKNVRLALGFRLACNVSGIPTPNTTWWHNGNPLKTDARVRITNDGLLLTNTNTADVGIYQCVASNEYGVTWAAARLHINDSSNPSAPNNTFCKPLSPNSIRVYWSQPKDDSTQPPITLNGISGKKADKAYTVMYRLTNGSKEFTYPTIDNPYDATNLQPNQSYTFQVRTYGGVSGSNPSDEVTCYTLPLETDLLPVSSTVKPTSTPVDDDFNTNHVIKPRNESILFSRFINQTTAEVRWKMDTPSGITYDKFFLKYKKHDDDDTITIPVNFEDKQAVLSNLDPQSKYDISLMIVVNRTEALVGFISYDGKTFVAPKDGFEIFAKPVSSSSVNVTWATPLQMILTNFDIAYNADKSDQWTEIPANRARYAILENLSPDTSYTIILRMNDANDVKVPVASTRIQTWPNLSPTVENISAQQISANGIRISWAGSANMGYLVGVRPSPHNDVSVQTNSVEFVDLKPGVKYTIIVTAKTNDDFPSTTTTGKSIHFTLNRNFDDKAHGVTIFGIHLSDDQMLGVVIGLTIGCVFIVLCVIAVIYCKHLEKYKRRRVTNRSDVFTTCERNELKIFPRNANGYKLYGVESNGIREENDKLLNTDSRMDNMNLSLTLQDQKDNEYEGGDSGYCDRHHSRSPYIKENDDDSVHRRRKCSDVTVDDGFSENEPVQGVGGATSSNDSNRFA